MKKLQGVWMSIAVMLLFTACEEEGLETTEMTSTPKASVEEEISIPGLIEDQSFEVELDDWGTVMFASIAPEEGLQNPTFMLFRDGEEVYIFPKADTEHSDTFVNVSAVAFRDFNEDEYTDVLVLVEYTNGESSWQEPQIFLQENADNMFYENYPDMESYKVEAPSEEGPAFYRDLFLEEYLSEQHLTETIGDMAENWSDYRAQVDALFYPSFSAEEQIEFFAQQKDVWTEDMEYADSHCYTMIDLNYNGRIMLIVSNSGGTGFYTTNHFYQIDSIGNVVELSSPFMEYDTQPDLMSEEEVVVYSDLSTTPATHYGVVYDMTRISVTNYIYATGAISISDGKVNYTNLAIQEVEYTGEDGSAVATAEDLEGNPLTEEEYEQFADTYYRNLGYEQTILPLEWRDISEIAELSNDEVLEILRKFI